MFQTETLQTNFKRRMNFFAYTRNYFVRNNPIKAMADDIVNALKEALTVRKKLKMAQYRLNYHKYQNHYKQFRYCIEVEYQAIHFDNH